MEKFQDKECVKPTFEIEDIETVTAIIETCRKVLVAITRRRESANSLVRWICTGKKIGPHDLMHNNMLVLIINSMMVELQNNDLCFMTKT